MLMLFCEQQHDFIHMGLNVVLMLNQRFLLTDVNTERFNVGEWLLGEDESICNFCCDCFGNKDRKSCW